MEHGERFVVVAPNMRAFTLEVRLEGDYEEQLWETWLVEGSPASQGLLSRHDNQALSVGMAVGLSVSNNGSREDI